jgi:hypothetical protein
MSITVDIPGGTAVLREKLKVRERRVIEAAGLGASGAIAKMPTSVLDGSVDPTTVRMDAVAFTADEAGSVLAVQDAAIVAYLESWTLPDPLPTMETIGDMETDVYDALAIAIRDIEKTSPPATNFAVTTDQDSPTSDSRSSNGQSPADLDVPSTETLPTSGESTDTAPSTPA